MTERDTFLKAILTEPDENLHRLAFADWLEEQGNPEDSARSEFIKLQIENDKTRAICRCGGCSGKRNPGGQHHNGPCAVSSRDRMREKELLETQRTIFGKWMDSSQFTRGFVSEVICSAQTWERRHSQVYWHPDQQETCPTCNGTGIETRSVRESGRAHAAQGGCETCGGSFQSKIEGSGYVPREFVNTAHPIKRVYLTTWPVVYYSLIPNQAADIGTHMERTLREDWCPLWPHIQFTFPNQGERNG